jgi:2-isopropylmalate synthase
MKIKIYDTTLRDGTQAEDVSLSSDEKLKIALELDKLGFDYIEGGWPGSNAKDKEFFEKAKKTKFTNSKLAAFSMTRRKNMSAKNDLNIQELLKAETPVITIVGKSWDKHVDFVLKVSLEENLEMISDTIKFLKENGREVIFDAEHYFDGFKANKEYALKTLSCAQDAGVDCIVLCDTNGGTMTNEIKEIIKETKKEIEVELGIHCHNDSGLSDANSIAAVEEGITHIQGTINGVGERTGNANIITIISNLQLKKKYDCISFENIKQLKAVSLFVYELMNIVPDKKLPYVGESAFAHKGGMHADAVNKDPKTYEHIEPGVVGNIRRFLASDLSGKSNILSKAKEFGVELDDLGIREITILVKEKENEGYHYEVADASLELLMIKHKENYKPLFKTDKFKVMIERDGSIDMNKGFVNVEIDGNKKEGVSEGNGPVDALNRALRICLSGVYSDIDKIHLTNFKVRIIDCDKGTEAKTRVLIESTDGENVWTTIGVSSDIITASYEALVESIEFGLMKNKENRL